MIYLSKASIYFDLENADSKHDIKEIKKQLDKIPGVFSVSVNNERGQVAVDFDTTGTNPNQIKNRFKDMGYEISGEHFEEHIM